MSDRVAVTETVSVTAIAAAAPPPTAEQAAKLRALLPVPSAGNSDAA